VSGIVGAAGGLGGFFLPVVLGAVQQLTGNFSAGFLLFAFVGLGCAAGVRYVSSLWERAPMSAQEHPKLLTPYFCQRARDSSHGSWFSSYLHLGPRMYGIS
jgi:hypothetical protein